MQPRLRRYAEWKRLWQSGKLPPWEPDPPGYLLHEARESAGLSQRDLGKRLKVVQQSIYQAERWVTNPTVAFMRRWAAACGETLVIHFK